MSQYTERPATAPVPAPFAVFSPTSFQSSVEKPSRNGFLPSRYFAQSVPASVTPAPTAAPIAAASTEPDKDGPVLPPRLVPQLFVLFFELLLLAVNGLVDLTRLNLAVGGFPGVDQILD